MAWIIGIVTDEECKRLQEIGWEDYAPPEEMLSEDELRGSSEDSKTRAFFVDNDVFSIMTGPDWEQPNAPGQSRPASGRTLDRVVGASGITKGE
jgi:hypothetical protein